MIKVKTDSLAVFLIALAGLAVFALGIYWLFWMLWCWVLPQLWPTGPANIIAPGYWLFAGAFFLLSIIGKAMLGRK
jgi:hypothetical protein